MLFGHKPHVYLIYFAIVDDTVHVIHIRDGARREPKTLPLPPRRGDAG